MARRLPGIRGRLEEAAIELFAAQGFANTTAAEIAARVGTTERTFFRHFPDKADAAFGDETRLRQVLGEAIAELPDASPWTLVHGGLRALAGEFDAHRDALHRRARVVADNPALREREIGRTTAWTEVVVTALTTRGVDPGDAALAGALGLTTFRVALGRWQTSDATLRQLVDAAFRDAEAQVGSGRSR